MISVKAYESGRPSPPPPNPCFCLQPRTALLGTAVVSAAAFQLFLPPALVNALVSTPAAVLAAFAADFRQVLSILGKRLAALGA
ncbi:hypothetical protein, partial [Stenotrophomonas maltophilia]|uniref:hypothetical protein n=1 Tax=Stenotrophomonas maltophilia TaxID=40324 RepID=UPI002554D700